jgi:hypothetical protein
MKTPFQHFIQLAQRVLEATNERGTVINPCKGITTLSDVSLTFGSYPVICRVQLIEISENTTQANVSFECPTDYDCNGYDQLFIEWTKNVDDFLASDSILLLDNQIKAGLRK